MQFAACNLFREIAATDGERSRLVAFFDASDFADTTKLAMRSDIEKFARWFTSQSGGTFESTRVAVADLTAFRQHLREEKRQAVKTVNRCLVTLRCYLGWQAKRGWLTHNPAEAVKQIGQQQAGPKGLSTPDVRTLLRHAELTGDVRGSAILHVFLLCGLRVSELADLRLDDVQLGDRGGALTVRHGKGNKERVVPVPHQARVALQRYLAVRPQRGQQHLFVGRSGVMSARAVRMVAEKFVRETGVVFSCHTLRHTMARAFLKKTNDLVATAALLGHGQLQTTRLYVVPTPDDLARQAEDLAY